MQPADLFFKRRDATSQSLLMDYTIQNYDRRSLLLSMVLKSLPMTWVSGVSGFFAALLDKLPY